MEEMIKIVNQLQDIFSGSGLVKFDLPQIVMVGEQSSGKSSVLEHLVGRSFLPRGTGRVTRCPLELQLVNSKDEANAGDCAIFQHKKSVVFRDYQEITKEIEAQTERLAGGDKGICSTPIILKMYSTTFTNLTLVDLPGLTKVPVENQSEDFEQHTSKLILKYIKNPNSIILAVVPANADMETCESLKIAREVDPEGDRTLAVVTKLDLMDEGTGAKDMLSGSVIPVKLGIIGVVNRLQIRILNNNSMEQSLKDEAAFFSQNYKGQESVHGTPFLKKTIQTILINNIEQYFPNLKARIGEKLEEQRLKLGMFKNVRLNGSKCLMGLILQFFNNFCGTMNGSLTNIDTKELNGGASVYYLFRCANKHFEETPLTSLSQDEVSKLITNTYGINIPCFPRNTAFELIVKEEIKQLQNLCFDWLSSVHEDLLKIIHNCINDPELQLKRYPTLQKLLLGVALDLLKSRYQISKTMVQDNIDIHLAYINYNHPEFSTEEEFTSESTTQLEQTISDIESYFIIVKKSIQDMLPKVMMQFMVKAMMERLLPELVSRLCHGDDSDLLQESPELIEEITKIKESILVLEKAENLLNFLKPSQQSTIVNSYQKPTLPDTTKVEQTINTGVQQNKACNHKYHDYLLFIICLVVVVMSYCFFKINLILW